MIDRQSRKIVFECDMCPETFSGAEGDEFAEAWAAAKRADWRTKKIADEWLHACPTCRF